MMKKINNEIFMDYLSYQILSSFLKNFYYSDNTDKVQMLSMFNDAMIHLKNDI